MGKQGSFGYVAASLRGAATPLRMTHCGEAGVLRFAQDDILFVKTGTGGLVPLRELSYCLGDLRQLGVGGAALQPQFVIDGGSAADHGSGGNVVGDAALGDGDGAVSDFDVAGDAYLSRQDDVVAYVGCAG